MSTQPLQNFGELLRACREHAHLTQEDLAERSGVSARAISDLERGIKKRPQAQTVQKLVTALQLDARERLEFERIARPVRDPRPVKGPEQTPPRTQTIQLRGAAPHTPEQAAATGGSVVAVVPPLPSLAPQPDRVARGGLPLEADKNPTPAPLLLHHYPWNWKVWMGGLLLVLLLFRDPLLGLLPFTASGDSCSVLDGIDLGALPVRDGVPVVTTGQAITAQMVIRNSGPKTVLLQAISLGVRGPDACVRGWGANNYDFPQSSPVWLPPAGEVRYQQTHVFDTPGIYFVEPVKQEWLRGWGGVWPSPRIWVIVVDAQTGSVPAIACTTPVATRPPAFLALPTPPTK